MFKRGLSFCCIKKRYIILSWEKTRDQTNLKSIVSGEYHTFLDIFLKKESNTLSPYQKYDHKIRLKEKQKPDHVPLYTISSIN